jgi:hypothetical protein
MLAYVMQLATIIERRRMAVATGSDFCIRAAESRVSKATLAYKD